MAEPIGKSPAFMFYAGDFVTDTQELSNEVVGVYLRLLCYQWINGSIPAGIPDMARLVSIDTATMANQVWPKIAHKFETIDVEGYFACDRVANPRLERERQRMIAWREERQQSGLKGAQKRWGKGKAQAMAQPSNSHKLKDGISTSNSNTPSVVSPRPKRKARRVPKSWKPITALMTWCHQYVPGDTLDVEDFVEKEVAKMRDYEFKNPRSDWDAAFRNWIRKAIEDGHAPKGGPMKPGMGPKRRDITDLAEIMQITRKVDEDYEVFAARVLAANAKRIENLGKR